MSRRRAVAWGAAAVAVALAVWWIWPRGDVEAAPGPAPPPVAAAPRPPDPPVGAAPEPPGADAPEAALPDPDDPSLPEPVRRYLAATVYPPSSGRLTREHVDLLHPNRRHERPRPVPDTLSHDPSETVSYLLTADRYYYEGGATVQATLEAWRGDAPIRPEVVSARALREGRGGPEGEPLPVEFVWRGGRLEARIPLAAFHDHHGPVLVEVSFAWEPGGATHHDVLRLFHTPADRIPAQATGLVEDSVRDGNLRLDFGVNVSEPGFYRFDANVFDASGEPVAFAVFKGELGPGSQTVPLEVFGKVLRDAGVPGPYELRQVRGYRFLDGQYPDRERLADIDGRWTTEAWPLDAFGDAPWAGEHKQRMVELMLEDEAHGIPVEAPALPGGPVAR